MATRILIAAVATAMTGGAILVACSGGQAPTALEPQAVQSSTPSASALSDLVAESGNKTCPSSKNSWCHVPDGQAPLQLCINNADLAVHQQHPNDFAPKTFYRDADGDGYGSGAAQTGCVVPQGYVETAGDCNDDNAAIHPGAADATCNGVDDDCDGTADDEFPSQATSCGVGACGATGATSCSGGTIVDSCSPGNPSTEVCDSVDNDCDGSVDEGNVCVCPCDALFDQTVQAWEAARGTLTGSFAQNSATSSTCVDTGPGESDRMILSSESFGPAGVVGCLGVARVGGEDLVNTLIPATPAERAACVASVQSRCTP